ncbi:MAG: hypothetical protein HXX14_10530 [Bacteroidetes bacterium]|nr:hypothetical protein [Bacteroidota bacterium]
MNSITFRNLENSLNDNFFAILDLETTGFSPKNGDKIVEIAIISIDCNGNEIDRFETLINPRREVSATSIHGITAEMLQNAPTIDMVIGDIIHHLNNKTIVGHNIQFDLSFINHEVKRHFKIQDEIYGVCTLNLSKIIEPDLPMRKLETLCNYFNIENKNSHTAIGDCQATVQLFTILRDLFIEKYGIDKFCNFINPLRLNVDCPISNHSFRRENAIAVSKRESNQFNAFLNRLSTIQSDEIPIQQYLNILDDILADRLITQEELETLADLSAEYKISQSQAIEIHQEYVRKLVRIYLLDNILTQSETADLEKVCELLSISTDVLEKIVKYEKVSIHENLSPADKQDYKNKSVCFTGQLNSKLNGCLVDRPKAQQLAMERGMVIKNGVVKDLDYLVVADPYSLSSKSQKAHEYGIKILAEPVFWNMIGVLVE